MVNIDMFDAIFAKSLTNWFQFDIDIAGVCVWERESNVAPLTICLGIFKQDILVPLLTA